MTSKHETDSASAFCWIADRRVLGVGGSPADARRAAARFAAAPPPHHAWWVEAGRRRECLLDGFPAEVTVRLVGEPKPTGPSPVEALGALLGAVAADDDAPDTVNGSTYEEAGTVGQDPGFEEAVEVYTVIIGRIPGPPRRTPEEAVEAMQVLRRQEADTVFADVPSTAQVALVDVLLAAPLGRVADALHVLLPLDVENHAGT